MLSVPSTKKRRRSWDRRAAYIRKYGPLAGPVILRLLALHARDHR